MPKSAKTARRTRPPTAPYPRQIYLRRDEKYGYQLKIRQEQARATHLRYPDPPFSAAACRPDSRARRRRKREPTRAARPAAQEDRPPEPAPPSPPLHPGQNLAGASMEDTPVPSDRELERLTWAAWEPTAELRRRKREAEGRLGEINAELDPLRARLTSTRFAAFWTLLRFPRCAASPVD